MSDHPSALALARAQVAPVRDDPAARLELMSRVFRGPTGRAPRHLPFRRAALSFMRWQARRGVLNPLDASPPGSVWWRAVNERLLHDGCETVALLGGSAGEPSSPAVRLWLEFGARPTGRNWYRAHNASIVAGYLENRHLAEAEAEPERFFMNVALVRVLYAHALGAAPRLALGRFAPLGRLLGDPRLGMAGAFLSLGRVLPDRYPLVLDVERYIADEQRLGRHARLRGDRAAAATPVRVVGRRARRTTRAGAGARRQPDLRLALRAATRVAHAEDAVHRPGTRTRYKGSLGSLSFSHRVGLSRQERGEDARDPSSPARLTASVTLTAYSAVNVTRARDRLELAGFEWARPGSSTADAARTASSPSPACRAARRVCGTTQ